MSRVERSGSGRQEMPPVSVPGDTPAGTLLVTDRHRGAA